MSPVSPSSGPISPGWRPLLGAFVAFGGVGLIFLFGARALGLDGAAQARQWLAEAGASPWALPATVGVFALLAFLGVPQVVLIAAAVLALGPRAGMAYSWIGTLVSSVVGFWLGRWAGMGALRDWAGPRAQRLVDLIARNGFIASLLIRLAPSAPFIFVNMAAGVAGVTFFDFLAGTAIGVIPKIALTGLTGGSLLNFAHGHPGHEGLLLAGFALGWAVLSVVGYAWLRRGEDFTPKAAR